MRDLRIGRANNESEIIKACSTADSRRTAAENLNIAFRQYAKLFSGFWWIAENVPVIGFTAESGSVAHLRGSGIIIIGMGGL